MFFNLGMEENLVNRYFERMILIGNVKKIVTVHGVTAPVLPQPTEM
jgi:hypothetical protein